MIKVNRTWFIFGASNWYHKKSNRTKIIFRLFCWKVGFILINNLINLFMINFFATLKATKNMGQLLYINFLAQQKCIYLILLVLRCIFSKTKNFFNLCVIFKYIIFLKFISCVNSENWLSLKNIIRKTEIFLIFRIRVRIMV